MSVHARFNLKTIPELHSNAGDSGLQEKDVVYRLSWFFQRMPNFQLNGAQVQTSDCLGIQVS